MKLYVIKYQYIIHIHLTHIYIYIIIHNLIIIQNESINVKLQNA